MKEAPPEVAFLSFQIPSKHVSITAVVTTVVSLTFGFLGMCLLSAERTGAPGRGDGSGSHPRFGAGWFSGSHLPEQVIILPGGPWNEQKTRRAGTGLYDGFSLTA